jgi:hypothetical protein
MSRGDFVGLFLGLAILTILVGMNIVAWSLL